MQNSIGSLNIRYNESKKKNIVSSQNGEPRNVIRLIKIESKISESLFNWPTKRCSRQVNCSKHFFKLYLLPKWFNRQSDQRDVLFHEMGSSECIQ